MDSLSPPGLYIPEPSLVFPFYRPIRDPFSAILDAFSVSAFRLFLSTQQLTSVRIFSHILTTITMAALKAMYNTTVHNGPKSPHCLYHYLSPATIKDLTYVLRKYPSSASPSSAEFAEYAKKTEKKIYKLPKSIQKPEDETLELCDIHRGLDPNVIFSIWTWMKTELETVNPKRMEILFREKSALSASQERAMRVLEPVPAMWTANLSTSDRTPPGREPFRSTMWYWQRNQCPACMLARIGSDRDVLFALLAGMIYRFKKNRIVHGRSNRVLFIECWLKNFDGGRTAIKDAWAMGKEFKKLERGRKEKDTMDRKMYEQLEKTEHRLNEQENETPQPVGWSHLGVVRNQYRDRRTVDETHAVKGVGATPRYPTRGDGNVHPAYRTRRTLSSSAHNNISNTESPFNTLNTTGPFDNPFSTPTTSNFPPHPSQSDASLYPAPLNPSKYADALVYPQSISGTRNPPGVRRPSPAPRDASTNTRRQYDFDSDSNSNNSSNDSDSGSETETVNSEYGNNASDTTVTSRWKGEIQEPYDARPSPSPRLARAQPQSRSGNTQVGPKFVYDYDGSNVTSHSPRGSSNPLYAGPPLLHEGPYHLHSSPPPIPRVEGNYANGRTLAELVKEELAPTQSSEAGTKSEWTVDERASRVTEWDDLIDWAKQPSGDGNHQN
ncbi:hypothetical protein GQ43DRAFT_263242 [Delitschia confertaspora ATCC 74209]|uniref:Uncharacterized protein n=1 Tax=Delitschia confertaspora ATCC 74209 TaxID=1513339 RepID=A0A9P4JVT7_9PLEO|nr:hypothetical protein GQ43DRAFT_263242 [Delitschia confertaspora ATCC 74209]